MTRHRSLRFAIVAATCLGFADRKSTRLNSSHTEIYTLSLHDALPILDPKAPARPAMIGRLSDDSAQVFAVCDCCSDLPWFCRSEEHTSELQSHRDLHSFPTRRSSDLGPESAGSAGNDREIER